MNNLCLNYGLSLSGFVCGSIFGSGLAGDDGIHLVAKLNI